MGAHCRPGRSRRRCGSARPLGRYPTLGPRPASGLTPPAGVRNRLIDLHTHILPGLDDGAPDLEASLAMARLASADGTTTIVATPHVNFRYSFALNEIDRRVEELNSAIRSAGLELEILAGAELDLARLIELSDGELQTLSLGDGPSLLLESPFTHAGPLEDVVFDLQLRGFTPVLAHPERCPPFQHDEKLLRRLVERGAFCSITAGSLAGVFGSTVRRFALHLLSQELVHDISSDAHDTDRRPPLIGLARRELDRDVPEMSPRFDWLAEHGARAMLSGDPPPEPPRPAQRRRWRLFA